MPRRARGSSAAWCTDLRNPCGAFARGLTSPVLRPGGGLLAMPSVAAQQAPGKGRGRQRPLRPAATRCLSERLPCALLFPACANFWRIAGDDLVVPSHMHFIKCIKKCILLHDFQTLLYFCRDRWVMKFVTLSLGQVTVTNPCVHCLVRAGKFGAVGIVERWSQRREKNRGNKSEGRKSEGC